MTASAGDFEWKCLAPGRKASSLQSLEDVSSATPLIEIAIRFQYGLDAMERAFLFSLGT